MAGADVLLAGFVTKATTFAQQASSRWYEASKAMDSFMEKSINLRCQSNAWRSLLRRYNMDDPEIRSRLEIASWLLDREEGNMKTLKSNWLRRMWTTLVFPESLTDAMDRVSSAFENLQQRLAEREKAEQQIEKATQCLKKPLKFDRDPMYVIFKETMLEVREALESETSETTGAVVTLSGGPGQGKTSMAKHLALFYQDTLFDVGPQANIPEQALPPERFAANAPPQSWFLSGFFNCCGWLNAFLSKDVPSNARLNAFLSKSVPSNANPPADVRQEGRPAQEKKFPDGVFFYYCGPSADSKDILFRLWQDLGYQGASPKTEIKHSPGDEAKHYLRDELKTKLTNQKILIVLDDIWERELVEDLLVQGRWVKYLITTQRCQLWPHAICRMIPMKSPTFEEEYEILTKHVSGFPKDLTPELKGAIEAFIQKSGQNPLVLANLATYINNPNASSVKEWESAGRFLEKLLGRNGEVRAVLFGRSYSKKTIQASITMAIGSFSEQEQTLLLLTSICEDQSIPEVVFQTFFKGIYSDDGDLWFPRSAQNLQNNNFLRIESKIVPWSKTPEICWVVHSTRQKVIGLTKDKDVTSLVRKLLECKTKAIAILLALYGQKAWSDQATAKLKRLRKKCSSDRLLSVTSHFSTIKPFVWLLQAEGEEEWEKTSNQWVEQVLLRYLVAGVLDDSSLSNLLEKEETVSPTAEALEKMATLKDTPIFTTGHPRTANALLNRIECDNGDETRKTISTQAAWLLSKFSFEDCADTNHTFNPHLFPDVMLRLVSLLAKNDAPNTQESASSAIAYLSRADVKKPINITSFSLAIPTLVALLVPGIKPQVQENAAAALGNLSSIVVANAVNIILQEITSRLVELLADHVSPPLQENAAYALGQLSYERPEIAIDIASFPGTIKRLVALLAEDVSPRVQQRAALALSNICSGKAEISQEIASDPDAIGRLVALIADNVSPPVQEIAAYTLGQLSYEQPKIAIKIASCPVTIARLVALLAEDVSPPVQQNATYALANICSGAVEISQKIASDPNAIGRLVALIADNVSPPVQEYAAYALGTLSYEDPEIANKIASFPVTIERLVALLAEDVSPSVHEYAAYALGNIYSEAVEIFRKIASYYPDAIGRLVALLAHNVSPPVQKNAAYALGQLSCRQPEIANKIASFPVTIERLVALLAEDVSPPVQEYAALAIGIICSEAVKISQKIASHQDAIGRLVALLADTVSPPVQENAAWVLGKLCTQVPEIAIKITSFPNAIERLVALLAENVSPFVQEYAAYALECIASSAEENAMRIASIPGATEKLSAFSAMIM